MVAVDQHLNHLKYFMPRQRISPQLPDKIGVFVLFWPSGPSFSGVSSTKSRFLCAFAGGWSSTCGIRLRKEGRHTGHDARIEGARPELKARGQN